MGRAKASPSTKSRRSSASAAAAARLQYKVKWAGWPLEQASWLPASECASCADAVAAFEQRQLELQRRVSATHVRQVRNCEEAAAKWRRMAEGGTEQQAAEAHSQSLAPPSAQQLLTDSPSTTTKPTDGVQLRAASVIFAALEPLQMEANSLLSAPVSVSTLTASQSVGEPLILPLAPHLRPPWRSLYACASACNGLSGVQEASHKAAEVKNIEETRATALATRLEAAQGRGGDAGARSRGMQQRAEASQRDEQAVEAGGAARASGALPRAQGGQRGAWQVWTGAVHAFECERRRQGPAQRCHTPPHAAAG